MLDEQSQEVLRGRYGAVATVDFNGHQLVFRRPSRDEVREFRRKERSPAEADDAVDYVSQLTMVAFDGEADPMKARVAYGAFLQDHPRFTESTKFRIAFNLLSGRVEREDIADMGKGVSVRLGPPGRTETASPNGSAPSLTGSPLAMMPTPPQS